MQKLALYAFTLLVFVSPGAIWIAQTGDVFFYFSDMAPRGQLLYVLSKLVGMYALASIVWQVILSLLDKAEILSVPWKGKGHKIMGSLIVILALSHLLLFFSAVSLRQGYPAWGMFLPNFNDYYHTHLTLGLIALWGLFAILMAGILRVINKGKQLHFLHKTYLLSAGLAYWHALSVGSEVQSNAGMVYYLIVGAIALIILAFWLLKRSSFVSVSQEAS